MSSAIAVQASEPDNYYGYRSFKKGKFEFSRDEYFVRVKWPKGSHLMPADVFLRALQRDVAWNFFYGTVNFDHVFGTMNHYGTVEVRLQKLGAGQAAPAGGDGAVLIKGEPGGAKMGRIVCGRGHMALLPKGNAYQFHADKPSVVTIQTVHGALTVERWAEICETKST